MLKTLTFSLLSLTLLTSLAGCSSTPAHPNPDVAQYCYTEETVDINNGQTVNSNTKVQCSDEPFKRAKYVGVDPKNCRSWESSYVHNGYKKTVYGFLCKDANGNWRPISQY